MSAKSEVVVSSPFLTVDQVAAELNAHRNAVRRLIALGVLGAFRTPAADGEWKVTPDALAQYVAKGSPRSTIPLVNHDCSAYNDGDLYLFSTQFEATVQQKLAEVIPAESPQTDTTPGQVVELPVPSEVQRAVRELGAQPALWWNRMPKATPSPYPTRAAQFVGARLLRQTIAAVQPTLAEASQQRLTCWEKLFDSPASYRAAVDLAWDQLSNFKIVVSRHFSTDSSQGGAYRVMCSIPYAAFGVNLADVEPLVF